MTAQNALEIAVSIWGLAMAVSPGLQIRQMLIKQRSDDVSIGYFVVLTIGFVLWTAYGISIDARILWMCNIVATCFGAATIIIALRLKTEVPAGSGPS